MVGTPYCLHRGMVEGRYRALTLVLAVKLRDGVLTKRPLLAKEKEAFGSSVIRWKSALSNGIHLEF